MTNSPSHRPFPMKDSVYLATSLSRVSTGYKRLFLFLRFPCKKTPSMNIDFLPSFSSTRTLHCFDLFRDEFHVKYQVVLLLHHLQVTSAVGQVLQLPQKNLFLLNRTRCASGSLRLQPPVLPHYPNKDLVHQTCHAVTAGFHKVNVFRTCCIRSL